MNTIFIKRTHWLKVISICLIIFLAGIFSTAKAQIGRGCYVGGVLYTDKTSAGNRYFYRTSGTLTDPCGYTRTGNQGNCRLYNGGNINNNNSYTLYNDAFSNDWDVIICPIDHEVWLLLIATAGFSIFRFKSVLKL